MSRSRDIAKILGATEANNTSNVRLFQSDEEVGLDSGQVQNVGLQKFTTLDSLPTTGLASGQQAWIESSGRMYISNGSGWYNVSLINQQPYWDSEPLTTYTIADSATPLIVTAKALDSDNSDLNLLHQSFVTDSAAYLVDITRDSSVFTFTPKSQDSIGASVTAGDLTDSNVNDFIYTFKWSDGISFVSKAVTINYNFATYTVATGGTITEYSSGGIDYRVHSFLSGTTNFTVSTLGDDNTIALLLVGGGAGGGGGFNLSACGGGGGAGAFREISSHTIAAQTYSIVVGTGGIAGDGTTSGGSAGRAYHTGDGGNGGDTTAFGYTANGGGGGTTYYDKVAKANGNASGGGNGGAGGVLQSTGTTRASGGTYGNAGGLQAGSGQSNGSTSCGGGGGAGGQGGDGSSGGSGGNGGVGSQNNYRTGSNVYYAGGGGGGHANTTNKTAASGGNGGGGAAGADNSNGVNGTANTGGGGGGGSSQTVTVNGGTGGSGIVVVRYVI